MQSFYFYRLYELSNGFGMKLYPSQNLQNEQNVSLSICSFSHHQTGAVHASHDAANVQDPCAQRAHPGVQPVGVVPAGHQVQRRPGHVPGPPPRRLLPLHLQVQAFEDLVQAAPAAQHIQPVHRPDGHWTVCHPLHGVGVPCAGVLPSDAAER